MSSSSERLPDLFHGSIRTNFQAGQTVKITAVVNRAELNGKIGRIVRVNGDELDVALPHGAPHSTRSMFVGRSDTDWAGDEEPMLFAGAHAADDWGDVGRRVSGATSLTDFNSILMYLYVSCIVAVV